jgi:cytochrome oxidase Cu insertion factor (SCO1/SenC/PrrC family)
MSRVRIVLLAIGAFALVAMIAVLVVAGRRRDAPTPDAAPVQHLRFDLIDHHGKPFSERDLAGRFALVYFGYTFCPDICPTELGFIHRLLKELGPQGERLVPLFITIDPARDTVAVLADYVPLFDQRIVGLSGTPEAIAAAAASVGAFFQRADVVTKQPDFYLMDHSLSTYLVGPDGGVLARYDSHDPIAQTLADLRRRLAASLESP